MMLHPPALRLSRWPLALLALILTHVSATALELPKIFSDGMVLQRNKPVPVWGTATAGETVTATFAGKSLAATTDAEGRWMLALPAMAASSEGRELTVKTTGTTQVFKDVLVGEVWLCSGQSNMEKPLGLQQGQQPTENYQAELKAATYPNIRLFQINKGQPNNVPQRDLVIPTSWLPCSGENLEKTRFSAVGYFFARELHQKLKVPVGIIHSSWGGTRIELWIPAEGFASVPSLKDFAAAASVPGRQFDHMRLGTNYNGMIAPIIPYALRGVLWYQGESNVRNEDGLLYADKMEALIHGWRKAWGEGDFPFYWVELAPYAYTMSKDTKSRSVESLPLVWEAQTRALRIPNTGMAVITDLVSNVQDIHPVKKAEVGKRLALIALAKSYGETKLSYSGPAFRTMKASGSKLELSFDQVDGGLATRDGKPLTGFAIAGEDHQFVEANAVVQGDKVIVSNPAVTKPVVARFEWNETAFSNFINKAGLPASPFRTDAWPVLPAPTPTATPIPTPASPQPVQ